MTVMAGQDILRQCVPFNIIVYKHVQWYQAYNVAVERITKYASCTNFDGGVPTLRPLAPLHCKFVMHAKLSFAISILYIHQSWITFPQNNNKWINKSNTNKHWRPTTRTNIYTIFNVGAMWGLVIIRRSKNVIDYCSGSTINNSDRLHYTNPEFSVLLNRQHLKMHIYIYIYAANNYSTW